MYTYPYQILKQKLNTDMPELRELDWYMDQDKTKGGVKATPAIYIKFEDSNLKTLSGQKIQQGLVEFDVILITDCVFDNGDKRLKKDQPSDHMRLFDKIFKSLQGYAAKLSVLPEFALLLGTVNDQRVFASLDRVKTTPPHIPDKALMKSIQRFRGLFYDHGAAKLYDDPGSPTIEVDIEVD